MKNKSFTTVRVLDRDALRALSGESNSSKYAIDAHNRGVEEIGDLSELPKLCSLDVSFNGLSSLQSLHTAKELRELKVYNNKLTSTLGLKANANLEGLMLHENQIDCLSPDFLGLGRLKTLWLSGNRLTSVFNLTNCRLLIHLDLARNQLSGAASEGLESLTSLEYLNLSGNQLSSIGNLSTLTKLEELVLSNNQLKTLAGRLPAQLAVLQVNGNRITDLATLSGTLPALSELYVQDNSIRNVAPLVTLCPRLESLDIRSNAISKLGSVLRLDMCEALQDLWIQGNPCCQANSYLLELLTALPNLKTLDSMSDVHLQHFTEKLRSGAVTQEAALTMSTSRPSTPSSFRPVTPLSRPGSSGGVKSRPMTPTAARPGTPEAAAPVFHQPSARMGALQKLPDPLEIARKHNEVSNRLREMKALLQRIGTPDSDVRSADSGTDNERQKRKERRASKSSASGVEAKRENRGDPSTSSSNEPKRSRGPETNMMLAARDAYGLEKTEVNAVKGQTKSKSDACDGENESNRSHRLTEELSSSGFCQRPARSVGVDAGTDPMDSFAASVLRPPTSHGELPPPLTASSHHEMETQTAPPPAAPIAVPTLDDKSFLVDGADAPWEPEFDGMMLEKEMKSFLLQHAKTAEQECGSVNDDGSGLGDNQADIDGVQGREVTESPRLDAVKSAELRQPPTVRSRQGYRAFRMPMRPITPNVVG